MKCHTYGISLWGVRDESVYPFPAKRERGRERDRDNKRESDTGVVYIA